MIAKIFPTGKGGISYLLSKDFCPVLMGDPEITQELILSSRSKNPSTAGVLTFEEYIEDDQVKRDLCLDFTGKVLAPGIDPSEISIVWVEHKEGDQESPRTGLHFEMSNTHLASGKQLQPYLGRGKKKTADANIPQTTGGNGIGKRLRITTTASRTPTHPTSGRPLLPTCACRKRSKRPRKRYINS